MSDALKPQTGVWTLTAPDGRTWKADSPLKACGAEQRERVPAEVAIARIFAACDESDIAQPADTLDAARYRFLRTQPIDGKPGQPVIAIPRGTRSGYYVNIEDADFAVDLAMATTAALSTLPICGNCDTPFPPGCQGEFKDDGDVCAFFCAALSTTPTKGRSS